MKHLAGTSCLPALTGLRPSQTISQPSLLSSCLLCSGVQQFTCPAPCPNLDPDLIRSVTSFLSEPPPCWLPSRATLSTFLASWPPSRGSSTAFPAFWWSTLNTSCLFKPQGARAPQIFDICCFHAFVCLFFNMYLWSYYEFASTDSLFFWKWNTISQTDLFAFEKGPSKLNWRELGIPFGLMQTDVRGGRRHFTLGD